MRLISLLRFVSQLSWPALGVVVRKLENKELNELHFTERKLEDAGTRQRQTVTMRPESGPSALTGHVPRPCVF